MQNHVIMSNEYFKNTIREYQDWQLAFFRETGQNSRDAKATKIKYTIEETNDGILVTCEDNGIGMDDNILINKFLVMGGSHKIDNDNVGGFGYAKSIILFCHKEYKIWTNDNYLYGSFGQYSNIEKIKKIKGTRISVLFDKSLTNVYSLEEKLKDWVLNSCIPNVNIYLNNKILRQSKNKLSFEKQDCIGKISFDDYENSNSYLWVRIKGLAMFKKILYPQGTQFYGYLDLNNENSLESLTANRDCLKPDYDRELSRLINSLSNERSLYKLDNLDELLLNQKIDINAFIDNISKGIDFEDKHEKENEKKHLFYHALPKQRIEESLLDNNIKKTFSKLEKDFNKKNEEISLIISKIDNHLYPTDFFIKIGKNNKSILHSYKESVKLLNQKRIQKLAIEWNTLINDLLFILKEDSISHFPKITYNSFLNQYEVYGKRVNTGFSFFTPDTLGMNIEKDDDYFIVLDIPKYKLYNFSNYDLMQIAIHEIAHIVFKYHSDDWASLLFFIQKAVNDSGYNYKKIGTLDNGL